MPRLAVILIIFGVYAAFMATPVGAAFGHLAIFGIIWVPLQFKSIGIPVYVFGLGYVVATGLLLCCDQDNPMRIVGELLLLLAGFSVMPFIGATGTLIM